MAKESTGANPEGFRPDVARAIDTASGDIFRFAQSQVYICIILMSLLLLISVYILCSVAARGTESVFPIVIEMALLPLATLVVHQYNMVIACIFECLLLKVIYLLQGERAFKKALREFIRRHNSRRFRGSFGKGGLDD